MMNKQIRQYVGLISAILAYYVIHEGAHLLYALWIGVFKQIKFMGLGMQIDVHAEKMTSNQMGIFCMVGSIATAVAAYVLVTFIDKIAKNKLKVVKASMYYVTLALLFIDPLYLSILCGFFGGGDMNGISLLVPEIVARIVYGFILVINVVIFIMIVLPKYKKAFKE